MKHLKKEIEEKYEKVYTKIFFWTVAPFPICGVSYMKKYQMSP